jgi:hypothetical protein
LNQYGSFPDSPERAEAAGACVLDTDHWAALFHQTMAAALRSIAGRAA